MFTALCAVCACSLAALAAPVLATRSAPERLAAPDGPVTSLHYAPNANFGRGRKADVYLPGADGFNLADVSTPAQLDTLPAGVHGLVYLGMCGGVQSSFTGAVQPFIGNTRLFGFYLMDEPDPTGKYKEKCLAGNLKQESEWIHANVPGARTFIVLMNLGTPTAPDYTDTYNSANSGVELFGLDPYPCMKELHGCDLAVIGGAVSAAEASGVTAEQIIPVYQAFGGGGYRAWTLPKAAQEEEILAAWGALTPTPVFDFAYSWGKQSSDHALVNTADLRAVFAAHNA